MMMMMMMMMMMIDDEQMMMMMMIMMMMMMMMMLMMMMMMMMIDLPGLVSYWLPDTPGTQSLTMCHSYSPPAEPQAGGHGNDGVQSSSLAAYLELENVNLT